MGASSSAAGPTMPEVPKIMIRRGDITTLLVEAIVNAANETGLGCFFGPKHCIDSAIHHAAGPRLRAECETLGGVPTGVAKITRGYDLPCKYVIHVTGPRADVHGLDYRLLAQCYDACLDVAHTAGIRKIAFCCLSTGGLFGFPKKAAAKVAVDCILRRQDEFDRLIFNVFTDEDDKIYHDLLSRTTQAYASM